MTRIALIALAAAAGLSLAPAARAQTASFCDGTLVANSFWSDVQSNGQTSRVTYWTQLRNTTGRPVTYRLSFNAQQSQERANGTGAAAGTISGFGSSANIRLGVDRMGNPAGSGALDNRYDLPTLVTVICAQAR